MKRSFTLLFVLLLFLTASQGLSLTDNIGETLSDDNETGVEDSINEGLDVGEREKYILLIDRSDYSASELQDLGIEIRYQFNIIEGIAVEMPSDLADVVAQIDFIKSVEPDPVTSLPIFEGESSEKESESYSGGSGHVIAVLDTGIDDKHIDLEGEVLDHKDFTGSGVEDRHGHGTHVAGIAAGTGQANSEYIGVAPEASLMNVKVLSDDGSGHASDAIKGIEYAVDNGADVIVMSLGVITKCDGTDPLSQAADNAVEQGVPAIIAAGNEGPNSETITSPGCGHKVFTVGASGNGQVASFSSRGATSDGRIKPNVVARGVNIYAAEAGTSSDYVSKSGTSMSAPYVGGAVTLLMDEYDGEPDDFFEALSDTAYTLDAGSNSEGSGQVNISAALNYWSEQSSTIDEDSNQERVEDHEEVNEVEGPPRSETRNGKEYWVYEGITEDGESSDVWVDKETGEVTLGSSNWVNRVRGLFKDIIALLKEIMIK